MASTRRRQASSRCSTAVVVVFVGWLGCRAALACYSYPDGVADPCAGRRCSYGARCRPSFDGLTARCQCPDRCDRYGDAVDAEQRCGDDGRDYASDCDMRLAACMELREIRIKYIGRCGQCIQCITFHVYYLCSVCILVGNQYE